MRKMMKNVWIPLVLGITAVGSARAEFSFSCGQGREGGPQKAEVALLDSLEAPMKVYLKGNEVADEKLGIRPMDDGLWIVTIDEGVDKGSRRFEFSQKKSQVQEFFTSASGKDKKVGAPKPCAFKEWEPSPEAN